MKSLITYLYTLALTAKKFGVSSTVKLYIEKDVFKRTVYNFKPKEWKFPVVIRREGSDWTIFQEVFFNRCYDFDCKCEPKVILDCGANIGLVSIYFAKKYPEAKLIAIEPDKDNYKQLQANTKGYGNIDTIFGGVWNSSILLEVVDEMQMGSWAFSCVEARELKEGLVKAFSLEDIMLSRDIGEIDILKIDIEGTELELFQENYEGWLPKTNCIIIELHDWRRKGCSKTFFTTLYKYDFSIYTKGETIICYRNK